MVLKHATDGGSRAAIEQERATHMLFDIVALCIEPEAYVCVWRDGELFIEPVAATAVSS
jgi:hypothetical protein